MAEFGNPYLDDGTGANPPPGVAAQVLANYMEAWLKMLGITLYVHEHRGLASVMDAVLRVYPKLGDYTK